MRRRIRNGPSPRPITIEFFQVMSKQILVFILSGVVAGIAVFFVLQKAGQPDVSQPVATMPPPALSPAELDALKAKAESGEAAAQTRLGWIYQKGNGVKPDMKAAAKWFQRAADQDFPEALTALGEMTQAGQGVPLNLSEAARLYRQAAEKGSVAAQYNLAYLHEQGSGVEKNETEAAKWYQLAAEGGDAIAQFDLGQRYQLGIGVATNRVQAFKWLTLAAAQGQSDSGRFLQELKSQMSADEVAQAIKIVREFVPRAQTVSAK